MKRAAHVTHYTDALFASNSHSPFFPPLPPVLHKALPSIFRPWVLIFSCQGPTLASLSTVCFGLRPHAQEEWGRTWSTAVSWEGHKHAQPNPQLGWCSPLRHAHIMNHAAHKTAVRAANRLRGKQCKKDQESRSWGKKKKKKSTFTFIFTGVLG